MEREIRVIYIYTLYTMQMFASSFRPIKTLRTDKYLGADGLADLKYRGWVGDKAVRKVGQGREPREVVGKAYKHAIICHRSDVPRHELPLPVVAQCVG